MSAEIVKAQNSPPAEVQHSVGATTEVSARRSMAEVQAMAYMAKQFPRDQQKALDNILIACRRPKLAKDGYYEYSKGKTVIKGVSIRVAEVMAREWGNVQYGFIELERTNTSITAQAYCWDMETNTRAERTVTIPTRMVYTGKNDSAQEYERSLSELVANQMQRKVRVCILAIIPSDIVEAAQEECLKTQRTHLQWNGQDGEARRREDITRMVVAFEGIGVSRKQLEKRFQRNIDTLEPAQFMSLRGIYTSIKDGMATVDSYFDKSADDEPAKPSASVEERLKKRAAKAKNEAADVSKDKPVMTVSDDKATLKEQALKEVEAWVEDGCEVAEDYRIAMQRIDDGVKEGTMNPDWVEDAKAVVRRVASKNGVVIK